MLPWLPVAGLALGVAWYVARSWYVRTELTARVARHAVHGGPARASWVSENRICDELAALARRNAPALRRAERVVHGQVSDPASRALAIERLRVAHHRLTGTVAAEQRRGDGIRSRAGRLAAVLLTRPARRAYAVLAVATAATHLSLSDVTPGPVIASGWRWPIGVAAGAGLALVWVRRASHDHAR